MFTQSRLHRTLWGGFWISPEKEILQPPWAASSVLRHPEGKDLLHDQLELPMLQFVPVAPSPVAGYHWKESGPLLLKPTLKIFIRSPLSVLQAIQAQLAQLFLTGEILQSPHHLCSAPQDSFQQFLIIFWTGEPRTGHNTPDAASLGQSGGRGEPSSTCWPLSS